jgi:EAL domain-containing protein (putative c-di-GMP-specific phosphodiesterase class I)
VLREACRQTRVWADQGLDDFRVAVNLSVRQLQRQDLPELAARALAEAGVSGNRLELEITETVAIGDRDDVIDVLRRIGDQGVTVAIDDFGTGYSVLGRLRTLPVDKVKIDRSFVTELAEGEGRSSLVAAIVAMAHSLGLAAVAEGVETDEQCELLAREGCDLAQGYLFSRPVSAEDLPNVLAISHLPIARTA